MRKIKDIGKRFFASVLVMEIGIILLVILSGAVIFHFVEKLSFFEAMYFTITTMATVGFGDIAPQTILGKIFVMVYAFSGVPLFISLSSVILETKFNARIKMYVNRMYKEIHHAEQEIQAMERTVAKELDKVLEKTEATVEEATDKISEMQDAVDAVSEKQNQEKSSFWKKIFPLSGKISFKKIFKRK